MLLIVCENIKGPLLDDVSLFLRHLVNCNCHYFRDNVKAEVLSF